MRKVVIILLLLSSLIAKGATYYVKPSGNDALAGNSIENAWRTVAKVNASTFAAGDVILFQRGGVWNETLSPPSSGTSGNVITFGAYGTGANPVLESFTTLTSWTSVGGGLYSKAVSVAGTPWMMTVNGINTGMGRYPNTGYLMGDNFTGRTTVTDAALSSAPSLVGGTVVVRTRRWVIDRATITAHSGTTLTFGSLGSYDPPDGTGFFILNTPGICDRVGEWAYVSGTGTIFMYFGSNNPNNYTVRVASRDNLIYINNKDYLNFQNIDLRGAITNSVYMTGADRITFEGCNVTFSGQRGFYGTSSTYVTISNCSINNSNSNGIEFSWSTSNTTVTNSQIFNTATIEGMSIGGDESYTGIISHGNYGTISYNTIYNSGYDGIRFNGEQSAIHHNFIDRYCFFKDDGAGVYMFADENNAKTITYNTIVNGMGAPDSWNHGGWYENNLVHSIYMDGSDNTEIAYNNCGYNVGSGIFNNEAINNYIHHNTMFDNGMASLFLTSYTGGSRAVYARGNIIANNIYCAVDHTSSPPYWQHTYYYATALGSGEIPQFGSSDHNYFLRPASNDNYIDIWINAWGYAPGDQSYYNLSEWRSLSGKDANSHSTPATVSSPNDVHWIYNETGVNKSFYLSASMVDHAGVTRNGSVILPAYSSLVLIGPGVITPAGTPSQTVPEVLTSVVTNITETTASCGGTITNDGGAPVTARGVCWGLAKNPTVANTHTSDGSGTGTFTSTISGLTAETTYYVRAYALNSVGYAYGPERSFVATNTKGDTDGPVKLSGNWAKYNNQIAKIRLE